MLRWMAFVVLFGLVTIGRAEFAVEKSEQGATVKLDGNLFTEYLIKSGNKPVLWPILGPTGKAITRGFPIAPLQGETHDHIHQRGLWFTHGDVNGVMFWNQETGSGEIVHREFARLSGGETGTIAVRNDWLAPDGKRVCEGKCTYTFRNDGDVRMIDAELTLTATDGELKLGDNKEGSFGLRVADSLRVDSRQGGKIVNGEGESNERAWGRPANWVDYNGPVDGRTVGVAIFDHPSNPGSPVRWHVRTYGLFAANPFTRQAFDGSQKVGTMVVPAGESIAFRYRVLIHPGDEKQGKIAERYAEFAEHPIAGGQRPPGEAAVKP
jgi:hypothetical protein